jgi:hypothetical protein
MKILTLVILSIFLSSCAAIYIPPETGPNSANLILPTLDSEWGLISGYSYATVQFGFADEDGCGKYFKVVPPKQEGDKEVEIVVPGDKDIFVRLIADDGVWKCAAQGWFSPEPKETYKIIKAGGTHKCVVSVVKVNADDNLEPVQLGIIDPSITGIVTVCKL